MANTRNDVTIPPKQWVDLYTLSGITVGTAVSIINKGSSPFYVVIAASAPAAPTGVPKGVPVYTSGTYSSSTTVSSGASGLWAYCADNVNTYALVQE